MTDTSIRVWSETRQRLKVYGSLHDLTHGEAIQQLLDEVDAPEIGSENND